MEDFQIGQPRVQRLEQGGFIHIGQSAVDAFIVKNVHRLIATLSGFYSRSSGGS
ncbi:hypothetical protein D3C85_1781220 [compost metagenome]